MMCAAVERRRAAQHLQNKLEAAEGYASKATLNAVFPLIIDLPTDILALVERLNTLKD